MTEYLGPFRTMVLDSQDLVTELVRKIGERDLPPMVHITTSNFVSGWLAGETIEDIVSRAVTLTEEFNPEVLAITCHGQRGLADGFQEHEVAVIVVIDRERVEVWEARLVRHDGTASLGAWRAWVVDAATGPFIEPVQDAMRKAA